MKGRPCVGCFGSELGFLRSNNHFTTKYPIEKGCPFETPSSFIYSFFGSVDLKRLDRFSNNLHALHQLFFSDHKGRGKTDDVLVGWLGQ